MGHMGPRGEKGEMVSFSLHAEFISNLTGLCEMDMLCFIPG